MAPILSNFGRENAGRTLVLKLNTDANPVLANTYGIQGIPTFLLFTKGRLSSRLSGAMPIDALRNWVRDSLSDGPRVQLA
jgi:thioredoxin-like negative regulator of GroEL